jgi:hypothetical protein
VTAALRALPKIAFPGTAEAMIASVSSQLGYAEGNNNDTVFGEWYGMPHAPWCAMFVSWGAYVSGNRKNVPKHAYTPSGANWFKERDQWGDKPKVGAVVYYDTAGLDRISHVGVVDRVYADGSWTSIEGNTNAAGSREGRVVRRQKRRTVGERGGFGYPKYAKSPSAKAKAGLSPVDLSSVIALAKKGIYNGRLRTALRAEGLPANRRGYSLWQKSLGYSGADADGIPGRASLTALGKRHGWTVKT